MPNTNPMKIIESVTAEDSTTVEIIQYQELKGSADVRAASLGTCPHPSIKYNTETLERSNVPTFKFL